VQDQVGRYFQQRIADKEDRSAEGERVGGYPARPLKRWHRETALLAKMARPKKTTEEDDRD